jgi:chloramphenicol-sensitive protein RarD
VTDRTRGLIFGLSAYALWGLFPLYFPLLEAAAPVEILAHRIVWSFAVLMLIAIVGRRIGSIMRAVQDRRLMLLLFAAALTIALNWGFFIYGVNSQQVVQTSLGYFINPLVSVFFGVVLLHEGLRRAQWAAVALGAIAVIVLSFGYGSVPWLALALALSFGTYGLIKKVLDMGAVESVSIETAILLPIAASYLIYLGVAGRGEWAAGGSPITLLLIATGVITVVPLLLFGAAATRIPLTWLGLLQYTTPVIQFAIGVAIVDESMPAARWVGFSLVWIALVVLAADSIRTGLGSARPLDDGVTQRFEGGPGGSSRQRV